MLTGRSLALDTRKAWDPSRLEPGPCSVSSFWSTPLASTVPPPSRRLPRLVTALRGCHPSRRAPTVGRSRRRPPQPVGRLGPLGLPLALHVASGRLIVAPHHRAATAPTSPTT